MRIPMKLVLDLQGAQLSTPNDTLLRFARTFIESTAQHEVVIILNGMLGERLIEIRRALGDLLPQERIKVWHALSDVAGVFAGNDRRRMVAERIREFLLDKLDPDAVFETGFCDGYDNNIVSTIGRLGSRRSTFVVLSDGDLTKLDANPHSTFLHTKSRMLNLFSGYIPLSADAEASLRDRLPEATIFTSPDGTIGEVRSSGVIDAILRKLQDQALREHERFVESPKPKLAFISPLPPDRTGIAKYSADMLPCLADYYDIHLVVPNADTVDESLKGCFPILTSDEFLRTALRFDRIVYQLGNSAFHSHMLELLRLFPGIVVLHDFYISDLRFALERRRPGSAATYLEELYNSHGYAPLRHIVGGPDWRKLMATFPTNRQVLADATGIIVHSPHSLELATQWYSESLAAEMAVIPLVRTPMDTPNRKEARKRLGIAPDELLICSFGHIIPSKLCDRIIEACIASDISKAGKVRLVFVGELTLDRYGSELLARMRQASDGLRIEISGWVDYLVYLDYLAAADMAIQLRANSRGETSAAVLDCMNAGVPTIVNANGSMAFLPPDGVVALPDEFDLTELQRAIRELAEDTERRSSLGERGRQFIHERHSPENCAELYAKYIERVYRDRMQVYDLIGNIIEISNNDHCDDATTGSILHEEAAEAISRTMPDRTRRRTIFVDVSAMAMSDLRTGIQRVVRSILTEWTKTESSIRVEPVYATDAFNRWRYYHANRWMLNEIGLGTPEAQDAPVQFEPGDLLLVADFTGPVMIELDRVGYLKTLRGYGVRVSTIVYDLIPIKHPKYFPPSATNHTIWLKAVLGSCDHVYCISETVAADLRGWIAEHGIETETSISHFHLGADLGSASPTKGMSVEVLDLLAEPRAEIFLVVGTLEPRKRHLQILEAFEQLWSRGNPCQLVFVGKLGWMSGELEERLDGHAERGRRLHWLHRITDEELEKLYGAASCLIAASIDEGFGLPLIEAAQHRVPIVARDIPIFREVAGPYAYYFQGESGKDLAKAVLRWLKDFRNGRHPRSDDMPWLTWAQSAQQLLSLIIQ